MKTGKPCIKTYSVVHAIGFDTAEESANFDACELQAGIYRRAAKEGLIMEEFSDAYLSSSFANDHFDKPWSSCREMFLDDAWDAFFDEVGELPTRDDKKIFDPDVAWWAGFIYAQLHIETGIPSRELKDAVPFDRLRRLYLAANTYGNLDDATDLVCEKFGLKKLERRTEQICVPS